MTEENEEETRQPLSEEEQKKNDDRVRTFIESRRLAWEDKVIAQIGKSANDFLDKSMRSLIATSMLLNEIVDAYSKDSKDENIKDLDLILLADDYSFIAVSASKAFEGYLKKLLIRLRLVKKSDFKNNPFKAIGGILNGDAFEKKVINRRLRHIPKRIQVEWDTSRNFLMHYDLDKPPIMSQRQAKDRIGAICDIIRESYEAFCGE